METVNAIVENETTQRKDLKKLYVDISSKGNTHHQKAIDDEMQRRKNIVLAEERGVQYKQQLKAAKEEWKLAVKMFRHKEQLREDIELSIVELGAEDLFHFSQQQIVDIDDTHINAPTLNIVGGLITELMLACEAINKHYTAKMDLVDKRKRKPNPLTDWHRFKVILISFLKDQLRNNKLALHLPERS